MQSMVCKHLEVHDKIKKNLLSSPLVLQKILPHVEECLNLLDLQLEFASKVYEILIDVAIKKIKGCL